eukprot:GDKH01005346.1.p1 GENE.GDKH01005346.1~~GDKH01005346.1.p1  ORF type:complete len:289 (+),score=29.21 GDKH01005346.1:176-1042(+)
MGSVTTSVSSRASEDPKLKDEELAPVSKAIELNGEEMAKAMKLMDDLEELEKMAESMKLKDEELKKMANSYRRREESDRFTFLGQLMERAVFYCFTISRAVICLPSNLFFMAIFAPSRYESKLWDLKHHLASSNRDSDHIAMELKSLNSHYFSYTSHYFGQFLESMNSSRMARTDVKYLYYTKAAVDRELIRTQSARYMWNETDQLTLYGFLFTSIVAMNKVTNAPVFRNSHLMMRCSQFPSVILMRCFGKAGSALVSGVRQSKLVVPYLAICNVFSFMWNLKGYKAA